MENCQLVSVCIITYNSSRTVIETLDSVFTQSYPHIELIISDDCSSDDTVIVCQEWLQKHSDRFVNTELVIRDKNGGVARNIITAVKASKGEWVKFLAADDLLLPDSIRDNMFYVCHHPTSCFVFSKMRYFKIENGERLVLDYCKPDSASESFFALPVQEQYRILLYSVRAIPGPTFFCKREFYLKHPHLELYTHCEDWPYWVYLTKNGFQFSFFSEETVLYRLGESLSHAGNTAFLNERFFYSMLAFHYNEVSVALYELNPKKAIEKDREFFISSVAIVLLKNHKNYLTRVILHLFDYIVKQREKHGNVEESVHHYLPFLDSKTHYSAMARFYAEEYTDLYKSAPFDAKQQQKSFFLGDMAIMVLGNRKNFFTNLLLSFFKRLVGTQSVH